MGRVYESGATKNKKKELAEVELRKQSGALDKYLCVAQQRSSTPQSPLTPASTQTIEANPMFVFLIDCSTSIFNYFNLPKNICPHADIHAQCTSMHNTNVLYSTVHAVHAKKIFC